MKRTGIASATWDSYVIELDDGKIYRKALYLMVETMVPVDFPLNQFSDYGVSE